MVQDDRRDRLVQGPSDPTSNQSRERNRSTGGLKLVIGPTLDADGRIVRWHPTTPEENAR